MAVALSSDMEVTRIDETLAATLFYMPAEQLLAALRLQAPALARTLDVYADDPGPAGMVLLAAALWIALALAGWLGFRVLRFLRRMADFGLSNLLHQCRIAGSGVRTWLVLRRRRAGQGIGTGILHAATEFSATDLSILNAIARLQAGFSTSAPELAEALRLRPAETQHSLEKLYRNKLLDTTLGSTDGFDNYVISASGAVLMTMMARR